MFGENPIRPPVHGDGASLEVKHIFPTLQGEGPFVGQPSVFIRLAGCNLACDFCDTQFEDGETMPLAEILHAVAVNSHDEAGIRLRDLVVITGGEPLRQPIEALCDALLNAGYRVQIETNGTLFRALDVRVNIVCSPKNTGTGYHPIRADLAAHISAYKFILSTRHPDYSVLPEISLNAPVYVQPMDEYDATINAANLAYAAKIAQTKGYRLSIQLHKLLGIE
ncbi:MAG: 7-carboxy-7-deazaguanine synthase QueE [Rickettsiales bacterium]|nr:7-carboxy-7-deazaguanine synthase QueE [Rickettsiales bacterium]